MSSSLSLLWSNRLVETTGARPAAHAPARTACAERAVSGSPWPEEAGVTQPGHTADAQPFVGERRRHAAVLFADLSGFTALVDRLEPEDVYARVRPLIDELVMLVGIHGGAIQQVLGRRGVTGTSRFRQLTINRSTIGKANRVT